MNNLVFYYIAIGFVFAAFLKWSNDISDKIFFITTIGWPLIAIGYFGRKIATYYMKYKAEKAFQETFEQLDKQADAAIEGLEENDLDKFKENE